MVGCRLNELLILVALIGCGGSGGKDGECTDCDDSEAVDADGDGYSTDTDCNDSDPAISPDAVEECDEVDNDCDGLIDLEDPDVVGWDTWYADSDGDGYGDSAHTATGCEQPDGTSINADDCDDRDDDIFPDADEICDEIDNDCDGLIDADDDSVIGAGTFYTDADGDGYGDSESWVKACETPSGMVSDAEDCDDTDESVNPDGVESCGDGVDTNCDGLDNPSDDVSEGSFACAHVVITSNTDDESAGLAVAAPGDVDGDGQPDALVGTAAGRAYLMQGPLSGAMVLEDAVAVFEEGESGSEFGASLGTTGDLDEDGYDDVLIGAAKASEFMELAGAMYLYQGPVSGTLQNTDADLVVNGAVYDGELGAAMVGGVDLNDDGVSDLVVSAPAVSDRNNRSGWVYVLQGPVTGDVDLEDVEAAFEGERDSYGIGSALDAADLNGDGISDLLIGVPQDETNGEDAGCVYVLYGPLSADGQTWADTAQVFGEQEGDRAGTVVAAAGDLDGSGYQDLLVGAPDNDANGSAAGAVYVLAGPVSGGQLEDATTAIVGAEEGDNAGAAVDVIGDWDEDGLLDIVIGGPREEWNPGPGGAWVLVDPLGASSLDLGEDALPLTGETEGDLAGFAVAGQLNPNETAFSGVLVGAPGWDGDSNDAGAVYVVGTQQW